MVEMMRRIFAVNFSFNFYFALDFDFALDTLA